jgi:hypothetical protein
MMGRIATMLGNYFRLQLTGANHTNELKKRQHSLISVRKLPLNEVTKDMEIPMKNRNWLTAAFALALCAGAFAGEETWRKDLGKDASPLRGAGWTGSPVSLDAVHGNAVVLAFWNADVAC